MFKHVALVLSLTLNPFAVFAQTVRLAAPLKPCREQPALVGKCFRLRGRVALYNGAPTIRLWRVGTKRILGISSGYAQEGYSSIPREIEERLTWETGLWGEYDVCPFTLAKRGRMQMICVEKGERIEARRR